MTEDYITTVQVKRSTVDLINAERKGNETQEEFILKLIKHWQEGEK